MKDTLVRTREGTKYLNALSRREVGTYSDEDFEDFQILTWARSKTHPLNPEKLKHAYSKRTVRRLFEAGYLEYKED